jgi:photosystem II stability/assembly factor-like uncharacterized protein
MFTPDIGWAFEAHTGRVLRTNDGGLHWHDLTPQNAKPSSVAAVSFLDQDHAWLVIPQPDNQNPELITATAWSTGTGGSTWVRGRDFFYSGDNLGGSLTFVDAQHGWFQANLGGGAGTWYSAFFSTTDGGMQWNEVMVNSAIPPGTPSPGSFPPCAVSGITFLDSSNGWTADACLPLDPALFATQDGGHTWRVQELVLPGDVPGGEAVALWPPTFTSRREGVVLVGGLPGPYILAYTTGDAGRTWQPHEIGTNQFSPLSPPDFVDVRMGWFVAGLVSSGDLQLYVTHDGGKTWAGVMSNRQPGTSIDFITEQTGWSWSLDGLLLTTGDGGKTWNSINPQMSNP